MGKNWASATEAGMAHGAYARRPLSVIEAAGFPDYALVDSGAGRKLERFGSILVERPEPQALWQPTLDEGAWSKAHAVFSGDDEGERGKWRIERPLPAAWPIRVKNVTVMCKVTGFHHLGLFPEQLPHWEWMLEGLRRIKGERPRVLNLFAYTGVASLLAAAAGAEVTHVDASKKAIAWAKENQAVSRISDAPIRWILDDARKFVAREARRARTYHAILVDPPKFGRGPNNEVWELFTHLPELMRNCSLLLNRSSAQLCLTVYAIRASALAFDGLMREVLGARGGSFESGELAVIEEAGARAIGTSLFTRWSSDDLAR
jgi:23S rRNA (cytosine1962-C5)-methyltransferase